MIGGVAVITLALTGCSGGEEEAPPTEPVATADPTSPAVDDAPTVTAPETVDRVRIAVTTSEENLTPWTQGSGYPGYYMMTLIYDTLFWMDASGEPQPWLAEDFEVSDDRTEWRFTLHDGVTFHDGEALTSADVAFTIDYLLEHPRPRFTPSLEPISDVATPDDRTVVITLEEAQAGFLTRPLADLPIIPQHVWSEVEDPEAVTEELPIGSGPYQLVEYSAEQVWRFEAYPDHFLGAPSVGELVMPFVAEDQAAFVAVRSGEADTTTASLTPELAEEFGAADGVELIEGAGFRGWYLYFNVERAPWDEPDVRQALAHALDLEDIVDTVLLGSATVGSPGFVHRELDWANPDTLDLTQDLDRARELLDGLGHVDSDDDGIREADGEPISAEVIVNSDDAVGIRAVELIADAAAEVGIALEPLVLDASTAQERKWPDYEVGNFGPGDYTLTNHSWAATVQLDAAFLRTLFHSDTATGTVNRSGYQDEEFDRLADEMVATVDEEAREDLLYQLQEQLAQDLPALPLYFPDDIIPYRPDAFDQWTYYKGVGILNKAVFLQGS